MYEIFDLTPQEFDTVPLYIAKQLFYTAVSCKLLGVGEGVAFSLSDEGCLRLEIRIDEEGLGQDAPLSWLRAQSPNTSPKVFLRTPDEALTAVGIGATHTLNNIFGEKLSNSGCTDCDAIPIQMPEVFRYIGGSRFDPLSHSSPITDWSEFSSSLFILSMLELTSYPTAQSMTIALNLKWDSRKNIDGEFHFSSFCDVISAAEKLISSVSWYFNRFELSGKIPSPLKSSDLMTFSAWEKAIDTILNEIDSGACEKVVLARVHRLVLSSKLCAFELLWRMKTLPGYLFLIQPASGTSFVGCTPECLLKIVNKLITTEALAGTRPRGKDRDEDTKLGQELLNSAKDMSENDITFSHIHLSLISSGISNFQSMPPTLLKLNHIQHIHRKVTASLPDTPNIIQRLLQKLHPTPAVCGFPVENSYNIIRACEPCDRGFYAGPVGFMTSKSCYIGVAIRSVLLSNGGETMDIYAGAGIVKKSMAISEWHETGPNMKMKGYLSLFSVLPPIASVEYLLKMPNINALYGALTIEELLRCGVKFFISCPGSRCTPLTVALANCVISGEFCTSLIHHDERGAAFFAINYAKASGNRPCAVITTSGTAVANLLPGVVEGDISGLPAIFLTADRPSESRDIGANQTIDQVNVMKNYVRWFKDIPNPDDSVSTCVLLSDISYAVSCAVGGKNNPGPVHLNMMFRENLAPDSGIARDSEIRIESDWSPRCIDRPQFSRWLHSKKSFTHTPKCSISLDFQKISYEELILLIGSARMGILIVGTLNKTEDKEAAKRLAKILKWPVFADIASGLRGFDENWNVSNYNILLSDPMISEGISPDLIIQLGYPILSKNLMQLISSLGFYGHGVPLNTAILVSSFSRRYDPCRSFTHSFSCGVSNFVKSIDEIENWPKLRSDIPHKFFPQLKYMNDSMTCTLNKEIIRYTDLIEPYIARCISECIDLESGLFLSNSMPCRDMDTYANVSGSRLSNVAMNRGASGIDGILSSAFGYSVGLQRPVTLVIGDMALLHDLNALHLLCQIPYRITIVCINNGGGGIFSFLPVSKHTNAFTPYFDTPHELSFRGVCSTFGINYTRVDTPRDFKSAYISSQMHQNQGHCFIEAITNRDVNVKVHRNLNAAALQSAKIVLQNRLHLSWALKFPRKSLNFRGVLVFLHGFMGSKEDWDLAIDCAINEGYVCVAFDIPGHGYSSEMCGVLNLNLVAAFVKDRIISLSLTALGKIWFVGYSLGARIAMMLGKNDPENLEGLVLIGGHPGFKNYDSAKIRWDGDSKFSKSLSEVQTAGEFQSLLEAWYNGPIWGNYSSRNPSGYLDMIKKRINSNFDPKRLADALLCTSLARQEDLRPVLKSTNSLYIVGELDQKYINIAADLEQECKISISQVSNSGHAILSEASSKLWEMMHNFIKTNDTPISDSTTTYVIDSVRFEYYKKPLNAPLALSNCTITDRKGFLVYISLKICLTDDAHVSCGVGEISPLPGFHSESIMDVQSNISEIIRALQESSVSSNVLSLQGKLKGWLYSKLGHERLLPSLQFGLETALIHALSKAQNLPISMAICKHSDSLRICRGAVRMNRLLTRSDSVEIRTETTKILRKPVLKLKVGGISDSKMDAEKVNNLVKDLNYEVTLRLDSNQAWTLEQATEFCNTLDVRVKSVIEYIEEPLIDPSELPKFALANGNFPYALDESLLMDSIDGLISPACKAIIIKPGLVGGWESTAKLAAFARFHNTKVVISSAFDTDVGLSHLAIMASVFTDESTCHGLNTFGRFSKENLSDCTFESAVYDGDMVDIHACEQILNCSAECL